MTLLIREPITTSWINSITVQRNNRFNAFFSERLNKGITIITFITQQGGRTFRRQGQQILSLPDIASLPTGQYKIQRVAWRICNSVNFSGEAAFRASQGFYLCRTTCRSSSTSMRASDRTINQNLLHIRILTASCVQKLPDFIFALTRKALKNRVPFA